MELDDVLNGQEPESTPAPEVEEAPAPETEPQTPSQPRDESGRFAPKGDQQPAEPEAAPPAAETDQRHVPAAALAEERRKRQDLERRLAELEARPAPQPVSHQPAEPEFIPNPVDDPQGFYDALMAQARQAALQELMPQVSQQIGATRTETLRTFAAAKYADFAEVEAEYAKLVGENPHIRAEVAQAANPVERAYQLTKNLLEVRKAGSLDVEAIKAKAIEEYLAKQAPAAAPQTIPTTLADAQSSRSVSSEGALAPPSLADILGR